MIRYLQRAAPPPDPDPDPSEALLRQLAGVRRALPIQRLVGNGMDYADAVALHDFAARNIPWTAAAAWLGEANVRRAREADDAGNRMSAREHLFHAAACFRFAQSALMQDTPEKVALYSRALAAFTEAATLAEPPYQKVEIPFARGALHGWLMLPAGVARPPCVVVFGGADGWREEYHNGALALRARGVATLLLDGPGQGETRLLHRVFLRPDDVASSYGTALKYLIADPRVADRVGIWGNSLGGTLAALTASGNPEISACCVNSGSAYPVRMLDRFAALSDRLRALTGNPDPASTRLMLDALGLPPERNRIACPLLLLIGGADALFTPDETLPLAEAAPGADRTVLFWDDGDHCIYNHTHEKHALIADWFADRLGARGPEHRDAEVRMEAGRWR